MNLYTWRDVSTVENFRELDNVRDLTSYAMQSQYAASPRLLALCRAFQDRICPDVTIQMFYDEVFNIYTARGIGLDIWGRILGIGRIIEGPFEGIVFGFDGSGCQPFNQAPFLPSIAFRPPTYITLDDDSFRLLLLYKALANISSSDAATQNLLLSTLIDTGIGGFNSAAYVLEVDTMVIRWVFEGRLTPLQLAIFKVAGTLARGAGVGWELYAIDKFNVFGFHGSEFRPFNQAPFVRDNALIVYGETA